MSALKDVFIIIPSHNNLSVLKRSLGAIADSGCQVVVFDDGSTDGTSLWMRNTYPGVTVLKGNGEYWWTGALCEGIKFALAREAKFILSLNADVVTSKEAITRLIRTSKGNNNAIVASIVLDIEFPTVVRWAGSKFERLGRLLPIYVSRYVYKSGHSVAAIPDQVYPVDEVHGRAVLIPAEIFADIGHYDGQTFPQYGGDTDFSLRARKNGISLLVDPKARALVYTQNTSIISTDNLSIVRRIINISNYLVSRKHGEALRVWWILLYRHVPLTSLLPSYIFIISLNIYRRIVN